MSAAFDTVDYSILSRQLTECGIVGSCHNWIMDYLSGRSQAVRIKDTHSERKYVTSGVPQGSVLGPLLFLIYLTGIHDVLAPFELDYVLYADDLQIFTSSTVADLPCTISRLENGIAAVRSWLASRFLVLNDAKSEVIVLGSQTNIKKCCPIHITIGANTLSSCDYVRDLGVWLDAKLTFKHHVNKVAAKSFLQLHNINRMRRILPRHLLLMLVHSLVLSPIQYCVSLLYGVSDMTLKKLQKVVNAALRSVYGVKKRDSVSSLVKRLCWLKVRQRVTHLVATIIYGILKNGQPAYLRRLLSPVIHLRSLRSLDQNLLSHVRMKSQLGARCFSCVAPTIWNSIPLDIRNASTITQFSEKLKTHLLS